MIVVFLSRWSRARWGFKNFLILFCMTLIARNVTGLASLNSKLFGGQKAFPPPLYKSFDLFFFRDLFFWFFRLWVESALARVFCLLTTGWMDILASTPFRWLPLSPVLLSCLNLPICYWFSILGQIGIIFSQEIWVNPSSIHKIGPIENRF